MLDTVSISFPLAFLAGLVSFLSPCVLPVVPGYITFVSGMTLDELARWFDALGAVEALNLDGGGSTTLWVRGEPFGGIVNYPSDNRQADHRGERSVGSVLGVDLEYATWNRETRTLVPTAELRLYVRRG